MKKILTQYGVCALAVALMLPLAQAQQAGMQAAFGKDAGTLSDKFTGLARVMSGKYDWKPAQGVRSVAEVFNLIVKENGLLAGVLSGTPNKGAPPAPMTVVPQAPLAANPLDHDLPSYLRLPGLPDGTPVRVGIILPFTSSSGPTRALAASLLKAAELAMFAAGNRGILLMTADEGNGGANAANAAQQLLAQGAEVIVGPLFGAEVEGESPDEYDSAPVGDD